MRARTVIIAVAALAVAGTTTPAMAARARRVPKVCNLMTDAKGDGTWNMAPGVTSPALDILSADIATGRNELVAVLRMQTVDTASDTWRQALGFEWAFGANGSGTRYEFKMRRGIGPNPSDIWTATVGDQAVKFTHQILNNNTLVWRIQRKDVPALNRAKLFWTDFGANTKALSSTADNASNPNSKYPDKAPSCVTAR